MNIMIVYKDISFSDLVLMYKKREYFQNKEQNNKNVGLRK